MNKQIEQDAELKQYEIKKVTNKQEWESFLAKQEYQIFVQSWHYGEFNDRMGDNFVILGVYENNVLVGGSLLIHVHAKRGDFLYAPYSPILDYSNPELVTDFFAEVKKLAKEANVNFVRISPFIDDTNENKKVLKKSGFRPAPMHMLAEQTWILPLDQDEVDLLKDMNQNHRNLIRRCGKEGVEIKTTEEILEIKKLHDLLVETSKRHGFVPFSLDYIEKEFKAFQDIGKAKMYMAYHEGDLLCAAIIYFYGNMAVYRHSATSSKKLKIPSSYGIQWQVIQDAKARGLKYYNFWGIAPENNKKHPFYGITHFKKGFGGFCKELVHAHDMPIQLAYWKNWLIETIRRKKRGF